MKRKKTLQEIIYVIVLLVAIIVLFQWYTVQNKERIGEQNIQNNVRIPHSGLFTIPQFSPTATRHSARLYL